MCGCRLQNESEERERCAGEAAAARRLGADLDAALAQARTDLAAARQRAADLEDACRTRDQVHHPHSSFCSLGPSPRVLTQRLRSALQLHYLRTWFVCTWKYYHISMCFIDIYGFEIQLKLVSMERCMLILYLCISLQFFTIEKK